MIRSNYNNRARLVLSEPQAVYYAGQELTGYIELEIQNPIQFSAINVTFHGEARTHWTEEEIDEYNGVRRTRQVQYRGSQECLRYTQCLYGLGPSRGEGIIDLKSLPPGEREIPFKFILPHDIPSSFRSERGQITYSATALVEYSDNTMGRDELYHEFKVVAPMNLLQDDIVRPLEMHMEEVYSCCCSSRPMSIDIKCPVSGYCPGQAIPINIKIKNDSAVEVKKVIFELIKKELYRSQDPPSEYVTPNEVLSTIKTGAILSNCSKGLTCHLPVPAMIAPNMDNCDIIDIGFFLKATIKMAGCYEDLNDHVLLFIGLKPIPGTPGSENYVHPLASDLPNGAPVADPPLRANIEQITDPNYNSYPGRVSPYPADSMSYRPVEPLSSPYPGLSPYPTEIPRPPNAPSHFMSTYPGQSAPPYPTSNARYAEYPSPKPMGDIPPPKPMGDIPPPYPVAAGYPNPIPHNLSSLSNSPYPIKSSPYPTENTPYPTEKSPYPTEKTPYPTESAPVKSPPYPTEKTPYPTECAPFKSSPYPTEKTPYPTESAPFKSSPYPTEKTPYPTESAPFKSSPYPTEKTPYPTESAPIKSSPYPTEKTPYPTESAPYPTGSTPYPSKITPYPTENAPYPTESTPYPTESTPHPSQNPPYPLENSPYPPKFSPHPKTESISMTPLRTQNLGFVLSPGSPYRPARPGDENSPYTPLMQNYSPSAPPPST